MAGALGAGWPEGGLVAGNGARKCAGDVPGPRHG